MHNLRHHRHQAPAGSHQRQAQRRAALRPVAALAAQGVDPGPVQPAAVPAPATPPDASAGNSSASKLSKGFGSGGSKKGQQQQQQQQQRVVAGAKQAARSARKGGKSAGKGASAPGGRIDLVEVHDWGTGDQERLGELRVKKVEPLYRDPATADAAPAAAAAPATQAVIGGAAVLEPPPAEQLGAAQAGRREGPSAARRGEGGAADAPQPPPKDMYGLLCHEMAMAEKRGALAVAGPRPPPLQDWSFTPARYIQYLQDCLAVHSALDAALQPLQPAPGATANTAATGSGSEPLSGAGAGGPAAAGGRQAGGVDGAALLALLRRVGASGLSRTAALQHDLNVMCLQQRLKAAPPPGQAAAAHAAQLQRWGRDLARWAALDGLPGHVAPPQRGQQQEQQGEQGAAAAVAPSSPTEAKAQAEVRETGREAAASLLAHAFAVHSLHAAAGMRLGALAAERLGLFRLDAARAYHAYPPHVRDSLQTLQEALSLKAAEPSGDTVSEGSAAALTAAELRQVTQALVGGARSASMLLGALAHTT